MIRALFLAGPLALFAAAAAAAGPPAAPQLPKDDIKGRWVLHETGPIRPIAFVNGSPRFYTVNQPGSRLVAFALGGGPKLTEAPAGPGLISIEIRGGTQELWALDRVTHSVTIFSRQDGRILRTIRVGAEPHGLVFSANGDRAYVTCSAVDRVDVIDTASYEVVNSIPIPARNPRGIVRIGDRVFVTSFLSGNGTTTLGNPATNWPDDVTQVRLPSDFPGTNPLPDRDLFVIPVGPSPTTDALDPTATVTGLGTVLFTVVRRPGTNELWIPHTEALNAVHHGEQAFIEGRVVANRIAIVDAGAATPSVKAILDLDALAPAPEQRCAAPTDIAFTSDGATAFVCGYGSDSVAVLDATGAQPSWKGLIRITREGAYPDGAGSRCVGVDPTDRWLVVFNKGENSYTELDLTTLPSSAGFEVDAPASRLLGWDPMPGDMRQGRVHFIRTANSKSNTSSCQSCHLDGHLDGVAWDLGTYLDPEGTPNDQLAFPTDPKGPMVTQSVRRLKEVGPYHWRGEKAGLVTFNSTFVNLLEREENGVPKNLGPNFRYITQYMEHLAIPANPRQERDRTLTPAQQVGADLYLDEPVLNGLSCADCHPLPIGTAGEVVDNLGGGLAPATVVPSLRGVGDKASPPFVVGGPFGTRTELGVGYGHGGALATIQDVLLQQLPPPQTGQRFDVTPPEADQLASFLEVFDTGLAPATTWQLTANAQNVGSIGPDLDFLLSEASRGNCEVVYRYGPEPWNGQPTWFTGLYEPGTGRFRQASVTLPPLLKSELLAKAAGGMPVTFLGVPLLSGWPMGLDRDNDKLLDLDELLRGTDPENTDTDEDLFHDGYELEWGMDPLVPNASSPDNVAPSLLGPVRVKYVTQDAVKFEFETSEQTRILFSYNGGGPVLRAPLKPRHDDVFSEVINELEPNTYYQVRLDMEDLAGNTGVATFDVYTAARVQPEPARIEALDLELLVGAAGGQRVAQAEVRLGFGSSIPAPGYQVRTALYYRSTNGATLRHLGEATVTTDSTGRAVRRVVVPKDLPKNQGQLQLVVLSAEGPPGAPVYAVAEGLAGLKKIPY